MKQILQGPATEALFLPDPFLLFLLNDSEASARLLNTSEKENLFRSNLSGYEKVTLLGENSIAG